MRRNLLLVACIGLFTTAAAAPSVASTLSPETKRSLQRETTLMIDMLQGYHYSDRSFNELGVANLLDRYLDTLDKSRLGFVAGEIEYFHRRFDRNLKSVYLFRGDVQPAFEIFDRRVEHLLARGDWVRRRLEQGIRFDDEPAADDHEGHPAVSATAGAKAELAKVAEAQNSGGVVSVGGVAARKDAEPWPADEKALDERWEKRLRRELLQEMIRGRSLEEAIVFVRDYEAGLHKQVCSWDAQHVRELFLDSMLESFDAHSGYFSKESAQSFTASITGSDVGLGIDVRVHEGHPHVEALVAGGPADIDGRIVPGERLLAVQEEGGARVDVSTSKLREVFRLLSGRAGARVTLSLGDEAGRPTHEVSLARVRHERTEGHATGVLVEVPEGDGTRKVGLITLPAFYSNPEAEGGGSSTSSDVRELVEKLVAKGAGSIVLDLRNNGGGVMNEALKTVGLFISKGPVFLSRGLDRKVTTMSDDDAGLCFDGPLVVLISGNSASASEAFSGTVQWYGRALIIGSAQTFGKGSAQDYIDMRTLSSGALSAHQDEWGVLRLTRQLFYFPDGRSPQLEGVKADIPLPDYWRDTAHRTERTLPNALPNESIASGIARPTSNGSAVFLTPELLAQLRSLSLERQGSFDDFRLAVRSTQLHLKDDPMEGVPLNPKAWTEAFEAYEKTRIEVAADWNALQRRQGYAHERVLLASIARVQERHQEALRKAIDGDTPRVGRTVGGIHFYEMSPGGRILDVPLKHIDFIARRADAAELAATWKTATGTLPTEEAVLRLLARLRLEVSEEATQPDVPALFAGGLGLGLEPAVLARGVRAFMDRLVTLDDDLALGRFFMDVRRREALRVAADWSRLQPAKSP